MKKLTILLLVVFSLSQALTSQTDTKIETKSKVAKHFYVGFGFGIGFFYPNDVNDYIKYYTNNYLITSGV